MSEANVMRNKVEQNTCYISIRLFLGKGQSLIRATQPLPIRRVKSKVPSWFESSDISAETVLMIWMVRLIGTCGSRHPMTKIQVTLEWPKSRLCESRKPRSLPKLLLSWIVSIFSLLVRVSRIFFLKLLLNTPQSLALSELQAWLHL